MSNENTSIYARAKDATSSLQQAHDAERAKQLHHDYANMKAEIGKRIIGQAFDCWHMQS